jgi:hypothetical protein
MLCTTYGATLHTILGPDCIRDNSGYLSKDWLLITFITFTTPVEGIFLAWHSTGLSFSNELISSHDETMHCGFACLLQNRFVYPTTLTTHAVRTTSTTICTTSSYFEPHPLLDRSSPLLKDKCYDKNQIDLSFWLHTLILVSFVSCPLTNR